MKPDFSKLKIKISKEDFVVVRSKRFYTDAFANIKHGDEITVIIEDGKVNDEDIIEIERGWKLITFDTVLGLNFVGFIAEISKVLAEQNISIFVLSSYFTDHILVKEQDLRKSIEALEKIGVKVNKEW